MTTAATFRATFNDEAASEIARSIDAGLIREQSRSARFALFANETTLLVVAGPQEARSVELALAYGVAWSAGRRLLLALPEGMATATVQRVPWLRAGSRPIIWTHDGRTAAPAPVMTQAQTRESLQRFLGDLTPNEEFRRATTAYHLGDRADWVTALVDYATDDRRLDAAHNQSERSWHHRGQRVLSAVRSGGGVRVKAGVHYSTGDRTPQWDLVGPMSPEQILAVKTAVDAAVAARTDGDDSRISRDDEHLLQSALRRAPNVAGIEQHALRELPAWRPTDTPKAWTRGYIDLVGVDGNGDIVIGETKIEKNADPLFVLQGLDYYVWAQVYQSALTRRLGASDAARVRLNLIVGAQSAEAPHLPEYTRTLATALDDEVLWDARTVTDWVDPAAQPRFLPLDLTP